MLVSFVVAAAENGAIGKDNDLPWRLPDDLRFFKKTTLGKPVIMGRKTWESLGGKPLPKRLNIVLSSHDLSLPEGVRQERSMAEALSFLADQQLPEVCIIGGGRLFESTMVLADIIYLTRVHTRIEGADAFFPALDEGLWELAWWEDHAADEQHEYAFTFQRWERRKRS